MFMKLQFDFHTMPLEKELKRVKFLVINFRLHLNNSLSRVAIVLVGILGEYFK
jgi:hypothetical protein